MRPHVVLFDLDGTLTESGPGITRSVAFALDAVGAPALEADALVRFIGPPLPESFRTVAALDDATAETAVAAFGEYYNAHGMFESSVYPRIPDLLQALSNDGRRLAVATSKPTHVAVAVLEHYALSGYFEAVCGAISDGVRSTKTEVVTAALAALDTAPGGHAVLVGDRMHDAVGARAVGIECIGAGWGYGSRTELLDAGVNTIAADVDELASLLGVTLRRQAEEPASPSVGDEALA